MEFVRGSESQGSPTKQLNQQFMRSLDRLSDGQNAPRVCLPTAYPPHYRTVTHSEGAFSRTDLGTDSEHCLVRLVVERVGATVTSVTYVIL